MPLLSDIWDFVPYAAKVPYVRKKWHTTLFLQYIATMYNNAHYIYVYTIYILYIQYIVYTVYIQYKLLCIVVIYCRKGVTCVISTYQYTVFSLCYIIYKLHFFRKGNFGNGLSQIYFQNSRFCTTKCPRRSIIFTYLEFS